MDGAAGDEGAVLVVGAGQAGFQAALSLREAGFAGRVVLIGDEPDLPYQRPPLSKAFLTGKANADLVRLRPARFYAEHRIELRFGVRAVGIDRANRCLVLETGERLSYHHLILATGARNRPPGVPGAGLGGVFQLRSLADADRLRRAMHGAGRVVVAGGGFIGLEFAAVAAARGCDVTVVEAAPRLMARSVSRPVSEFFAADHARRGIRFLLGTGVTEILGGDGRVTGVATDKGEHVPAELVLVGIGVLPNTELAEAAGLATVNGIVVDRHLSTVDPLISAIGDCAAFPGDHVGEAGTVRLESVQNAVDQARCVARHIMGRAPAAYRSLPWFWSDQGPLKLQIAGLGTRHDRAVLRGDPAQGGFSVFCFRAGQLAGVESVNRPVEHIAARKLLERGGTLSPEQAADPAFDLRRHANAAAEPAEASA